MHFVPESRKEKSHGFFGVLYPVQLHCHGDDQNSYENKKTGKTVM